MKFRWPYTLKIQKRATPDTTSNLKSQQQWLMDFFGGSSESGETVNASTATKLSAAYACIRLNAETVASLPKYVIDETSDDRKRLLDDPVYHLIHFQPNPFMKAFDFWETVVVHLMTHGNAYARIYRNPLEVPVKLILLKPTEVNVYQTVEGDVFYTHKGDTIDAYDMLHYKLWSQTGLLGKAPIIEARDTLGLGLAAQKLGNKFFKSGMHQQGILEMDGSLDDTAWDQFQKHWGSTFRGMANGHNMTPIAEYGMKWKDIGIPLEQVQFLSVREFQLEEVCRIFGVPPHLIHDLRRATFSNIEHQDIQYAKYTIKGINKRIETENDTKLFSRKRWGKVSTKFNIDGLLRGDIKTRAAFYGIALRGRPFMTTNEVRKHENLPPVPNGDTILEPLNMVDPTKQQNDGNN